jgi:hypothetical protein
MASKSETGHAVNAANFSRIIQYCVTMGADYTPPDSAISVANLQIAETAIKESLANYNVKAAPWVKAVNNRELAIEPLNKLLTKVKNLVYACDVSQQFKDDVKSIVKEIQGVRAKAKIVTEPGDNKAPTDASVKNISAAQTGYDNRVQNFDRLIQLLKIEAGYVPVENELRVTTLSDMFDDLNDKNAKVAQYLPPLENARNTRNKAMYGKFKAGNELASKVKSYMKAKFGGNSAEYHDVAKWEYKNLDK